MDGKKHPPFPPFCSTVVIIHILPPFHRGQQSENTLTSSLEKLDEAAANRREDLALERAAQARAASRKRGAWNDGKMGMVGWLDDGDLLVGGGFLKMYGLSYFVGCFVLKAWNNMWSLMIAVMKGVEFLAVRDCM